MVGERCVTCRYRSSALQVMSVSYHGVLYPVDMISEGYGCCRHDIQPLHMVTVMSVSYHGVLYPVDMISEGYGCCRHDIQPLHMVTPVLVATGSTKVTEEATRGKLDGRAPTTRDRGVTIGMALSGKVGYHQGTDYYGTVATRTSSKIRHGEHQITGPGKTKIGHVKGHLWPRLLGIVREKSRGVHVLTVVNVVARVNVLSRVNVVAVAIVLPRVNVVAVAIVLPRVNVVAVAITSMPDEAGYRGFDSKH
nr:hypothetical protein MACL_00003453 [Theileria orientalis]